MAKNEWTMFNGTIEVTVEAKNKEEAKKMLEAFAEQIITQNPHVYKSKYTIPEKTCAVKGCEENARIVSIPLGGVWVCDKHFCEYKFEGKELDLDGKPKKIECSYSNVCKLCGEEIIWSLTEHLVDKHPNIPEVKAYRAWVAMLWAKFVESK